MPPPDETVVAVGYAIHEIGRIVENPETGMTDLCDWVFVRTRGHPHVLTFGELRMAAEVKADLDTLMTTEEGR